MIAKTPLRIVVLLLMFVGTEALIENAAYCSKPPPPRKPGSGAKKPTPKKPVPKKPVSKPAAKTKKSQPKKTAAKKPAKTRPKSERKGHVAKKQRDQKPVAKKTSDKSALRAKQTAGSKAKAKVKVTSQRDKLARREAMGHAQAGRTVRRTDRNGKVVERNTRVKLKIGDKRYKDMEKWSYVRKFADGNHVQFHYFRDAKTGKFHQFKCKQNSNGKL